MTTFALAADSVLWTSTAGPQAVKDVAPGSSVLVVDAAGALTLAPVRALTPSGVAEGLQVLTRAGDLLTPAGTRVATTAGLVRAADLSRSGTKLEVLRPGGWAPASTLTSPLDGIEDRLFVQPDLDGGLAALTSEVHAALVGYDIRQGDGWLVADLTEARSRQPSGTAWTWEREAGLLRALLAWPEDEARTILSRHGTRARMLWSHSVSGLAYEVKWVPAFRPVESRLKRVERSAAFSVVQCCVGMELETFQLELEGRAVVADLAFVWAS